MNAHKIKQDICEIGRRLYAKGFAAANPCHTPGQSARAGGRQKSSRYSNVTPMVM